MIGFIFYSIINIEEITISHQGPNEIGYGETAEVKIIINKESFSGPGRLKLDLTNAEGITILEKENDGSSFTFKNNEALFIWYDLPKDKDIEITYLINPLEQTLGLKKITGTFSYISNNDRKQYELPEFIVDVKEPPILRVEPSVEAKRSIEGENGIYIVRIHTLKGKHKGFARIKDELPEGYKADVIESAGGVFKNIDGSAKFIWSDLPSSIESFTVSYKLTNPSLIDTNFSITGVYSSEKLINEGHNSGISIPTTYYSVEFDKFQYNELTNDTTTITKEISVLIDSLKVNSKTINNNSIDSLLALSNQEMDDSLELDTSNFEKKNTLEEVNNFIETENINDVEIVKEQNENIVTAQTTKNNINYKVQILAAHRIASKKYISKQFNYNKSYDLENHEGWVKYTTGKFEDYKDARNKRNSLKPNEFPGPFVTAYNYGERITVQEALIISKQSWIP
jgi:hypothetical protein